jgi:hypothetical protein
MSLFDDLISQWADGSGADGMASAAADTAPAAAASVPDDGMGNVGGSAPSGGGMVDMTGFRTGGNAASYFPSPIDNAAGQQNLSQFGFGGTNNADMASLFNTGNGLGSGMGSALDPSMTGGFASTTANSGGGSDDFMTTLMDKVKNGLFNPKDPIGSIGKLVGILGTLKSMKQGGHNDRGMVTDLINQRNSNPYYAANQIPVAKPLITGRPASSFISPASSGPLSQIRKV